MKKVTIKSVLIILTAFIFIITGSIISLTAKDNSTYDPNTKTIPNESVPASTSLVTNSSIFSEITTDGLASYLKITIPVSASTDIKTIIIKQTVGDASYTLNSDELGNPCYYTNSVGTTKNTVFYFTRPATYNVYYSTQATEKTETCHFTPSLNTNVIESIYTTQGEPAVNTPIAKNSNGYYFLSSGNLTLPSDDYGLYSITSKVNNEDNTSLLTTIPSNSYGLVNYIIESSNRCAKLTLPIYVLTTSFNVEFKKPNGSPVLKNDYYYLSSGYVFNSEINGEITINNDAKDLSSNPLTDSIKKEIFSNLKFSIKNEARNETNTAYATPNTTTLTNNLDELKQSFALPKSDHTLHTFSASLANTTKDYVINSNIVKVKIITKIPKNEQGNNIFSAILGQLEMNNNNDYLKGVLNGYMEEGTKIYYAAQSVRVYNVGYQSALSNLKYIYNGTEYTINKNSHRDFTTNTADSQAQIIENGSLISFKNDTSSFDNFFIFSATIETYDTGYRFRENLLNGQMYKNGNTPINVSPDANQTITEAISAYKYVIPSNYSNFIPIHLQVTYNGTVFNDVYNFSAGDEIEFTDYGKYTLEFYNLPSYEFLKNNLSSLGESLYYYTINFTISGPSIYASQTDKTISNNMFTQGTVNIEVDINAGQKFIVYKDNVKFYEDTKSLEFTLSDPANWRISIINDQGTELKSIAFTIMDTIYQGFSLNTKDEYETLKIYKVVSSMPVVLEEIPQSSSYHILDAGSYRMVINTKENLHFYMNNANATTYTITESTINFSIEKSRFNIVFESGKAGGRISSKILILEVDGIELESLEVLKNNKSVATFNKEQLQNWESVLEASKSFSENGVYTFRMVDKFGNVYETQLEKYYKVNVALVFLILIIITAIIVLIVTIIKSRHKIKVK